MAELAIGISKTAVQLLADKVKSAIREEAEQWQTVQRDLVFITGEFEMMQSFLNSVGGEHAKNHVVRTWVRQVRELSYDVEDSIEFVLDLDTKNKSLWWLRLLPSCSCSTEGSGLPVDEAVTQMRQLKARVEDVRQRKIRYEFVGDYGSRSLMPQQLVSSSAIVAPGFDILVEARDTAARCRVVDLTKLVTETSDDLRVISVWGTGDDLGTMSVIRNMYDDPRIYDKFRHRAWVKMMHPVNPPELIRSLVVQFYANSCQAHGATVSADYSQHWLYRLNLKKKRDALSWTETSAGDLVEEFVRQVNTHRYLIILEDLSTVVQWDAIRPYLQDRKNGSCIVVSTRHHEIASLCTGKPYRVSELQRFSANQSICVFFNVGFEHAETDARVDKTYYLVGRDSEVEKLFSLIMNRPSTDKPHVVSVWGIPGSGRTAVVTNVYNRYYPSWMSHFKFVWYYTVNMSQPFNLKAFCRGFLYDYQSASRPNEVVNQVENAIEQCREILHKYRCLVVIDEVQSKEDWDSIKGANLISAKSKSCIVVITAEESVAMHCSGPDDLVCSIKCLPPTAAFDLLQQAFRKHAFQDDKSSSKEEASQRKRNSFEEFTYSYLFESNAEHVLASQNSEDQAFQNNGNTLEEQAYQNRENAIEEHPFQNNGNSSEKHASQNGNSFEEQALENNVSSCSNGNTIQQQPFQVNGNASDKHSFQNGNSYEEQASQNNESSCSSVNTIKEEPFQNNENSVNERAFQNDGSLFEAQTFQSTERLFQEQTHQNNGNSRKEQTFQNDGNLFEEQMRNIEYSSFEQAVWPLLEINKQEEQAFENSENLLEGQAFQNSENLFEEQTTFQNVEDTSEEKLLLNNRDLLEEIQVQENEDESSEEQRPKIIEKRHFSMSLNDPNVKGILSRSGGFPQVLVALGRYLANQHICNGGTREWQCHHLIGNFMQELQTNPEFSCVRELLAWMQSYFRSSPPSLMQCMLYLLIFPREQTFRRRRLVRRWIAEGYDKNTESNSLEILAGDLFDKLTSQCVMQQVTPTNTGTMYEVNGFFHEYMISRPMEEKLFFPLEVSVLQERYHRLTAQGVGQHLAIWRSWEGSRVEFEILDFSRLRSLTVFGRWEPFFISDKMRVLRVLDLEDAGNVRNDDVEQIGKVLHRLKFLSLRGCKDISRVPDSFGGLKQLQTLDIMRTSVVKLPLSITKLKKLQYLRAGDTTTLSPEEASGAVDPSLSTHPWWTRPSQWLPGSRNGGVVVVPGGIGGVTALQILGVIDVSVSSGRKILKELRNLTQLRKLGVSGVKRENCQQLCSAISCLADLESLSVWFEHKGMNRAGCLDAISQPPVKLQSLKLYGLVDDKLPTWIKQVTNLTKLNLQMTTIPQDEIEVLGNMPKLRALRIHFKEFQDGGLAFHRGFRALQLLKIACNSQLQEVTFHAEAMHNLEILDLPCHNVSSTLGFSGLQHLGKLEEVSLSGSYNDALNQLLERQLDEHPRRVKHVLPFQKKKPVLKVEPRPS